jgi:hypothetical protein
MRQSLSSPVPNLAVVLVLLAMWLAAMETSSEVWRHAAKVLVLSLSAQLPLEFVGGQLQVLMVPDAAAASLPPPPPSGSLFAVLVLSAFARSCISLALAKF